MRSSKAAASILYIKMCIHAISLVSTESGRGLTCISVRSGDLQGGSAAEFERDEEEVSALDAELQGLRQNVRTQLCCTAVAGMQGMPYMTPSSRTSAAGVCRNQGICMMGRFWTAAM